MARTVILDSGPLGLLVYRTGVPVADQCRGWLARWRAQGNLVIIPEIVDYELRRELLRLRNTGSIAKLDILKNSGWVRYLPLSTPVIQVAAALWAQMRQQGMPTAHQHELDIDVILSAQALSLRLPVSEFVIATTNLMHLARLVPAELWTNLS